MSSNFTATNVLFIYLFISFFPFNNHILHSICQIKTNLSIFSLVNNKYLHYKVYISNNNKRCNRPIQQRRLPYQTSVLTSTLSLLFINTLINYPLETQPIQTNNILFSKAIFPPLSTLQTPWSLLTSVHMYKHTEGKIYNV